MPRILSKLSSLTKRRKTSRKLSAGDKQLIAEIRARRLTYLSIPKLESVAATVRDLEGSAREGIFVEAGCALGGSAILIALLKGERRALRVYDVFGMIPAPTDEDTGDVHERYRTIVEGRSEGIGGDEYYGYKENLYQVVEDNFHDFGVDLNRHSVSLIKGLVQDTLQIDGPVALAHIDVDWYEPVMTCLQRIFPKLVTGGSLILDDYKDWGGCRRATDEFLAGIPGQYSLDDSAGSLKITRQ